MEKTLVNRYLKHYSSSTLSCAHVGYVTDNKRPPLTTYMWPHGYNDLQYVCRQGMQPLTLVRLTASSTSKTLDGRQIEPCTWTSLWFEYIFIVYIHIHVLVSWTVHCMQVPSGKWFMCDMSLLWNSVHWADVCLTVTDYGGLKWPCKFTCPGKDKIWSKLLHGYPVPSHLYFHRCQHLGSNWFKGQSTFTRKTCDPTALHDAWDIKQKEGSHWL